MGSYTVADLYYSLDRVGLPGSDVEHIDAAWGVHGREYADWTGAFLMAMKDGRYAFLSGWSDSSGWGCQDGADIEFFDSRPDRDSLYAQADDWGAKPADYGGWDDDPGDLNRWLAAGAPDDYYSW